MATYKSAYSGPQIDEAIGRVLSGSTDGSSNRNLLDNAYFVGGGSQQGGGQFPINQRRSASYSGAVYGIDRWKGANAYGNIALQSDGLQLNSIANAFFAIDQVIENGATNLNGKTVTLSVLLPNGDIAQGSATLNLTGTSQAVIQFFFYGSTGIAQVNASTSEVSVRLRVQNNLTVKVAAVKLELGSVSTLANDAPPHFASELAKCQRFYWDSGATSDSGIVYFGIAGTDALGFPVATPVPMRQVTPNVQMTVTWVRGNGTNVTGFTTNTSYCRIVGNVVNSVRAEKTNGFTQYQVYGARLEKFTVSCDL